MDSVDLFIAVLWIAFCIFAFVVLSSLVVVSFAVKERRITDVILASYCCALLVRVAVTVPVESTIYLEIIRLTKPKCQALMWWQSAMQIIDALHLLCLAVTRMLHIRLPHISTSAKYSAYGSGLAIIVWFIGHCATIPMVFVLTVEQFEMTRRRHFGPRNEVCFFQNSTQFFHWNLFVLIFSCFVTVLTLVCVLDVMKSWQALAAIHKYEETQMKTLQVEFSQSNNHSETSSQRPLSGLSTVTMVSNTSHHGDARKDINAIRSECSTSFLVLVVTVVGIVFAQIPNAVSI